MPKTSRTTADEEIDLGPALERTTHLEDITVNFVTIKETHDLGPILANLPEGHCTCPHWGYVFTGEITLTSRSGTEVFGAGDAFYMTPGHSPAALAGTEFVMFSPKDQLAETQAAIHASMGGPQG
jgi:hypothetical protein